MNRSPVPDSRCPHCGFRIETGSWEHGGHLPEAGDLTVCAYCAHVLRFGKGFVLLAMTERDERALIARDSDIRDLVRTIAANQIFTLMRAEGVL